MVSAAAAAGDAPARVMQLHLMETSLNVPCCSDRVKVRPSTPLQLGTDRTGVSKHACCV